MLNIDRYDKLEQLQRLKDTGAISDEEFSAEKNKLMQDEPRSKRIKKWLTIIIATIIIVIGIFIVIFHFNRFNNEADFTRNAGSYKPETTLNKNNTNNKNNTTKSNTLVGKHSIIHWNGLDISIISGYLDLKDDNTFKIYAFSPDYNTELINYDGTYTISVDKISINITRESGYDLGSNSRREIITIAEDNLAYREVKFEK